VKALNAQALLLAAVGSLAFAPPATAPAAFPGRNGDLVFARQLQKPEIRAFDLYAIWPTDTGYARRLTRTPNAHELEPAARPDGRLIAYTRILLARPGSQIWAVRKDGSHQRFIAKGSDAAWSPSGRRIVFVGPRQPRVQKPEIYIMRADGTHIVRLTNNWNASDRSPAFTPDGKSIVFLSNRDATGGAGNAEIWVMNPDGTNARNLTNNPAIDDHPAVSPDGTKILFERSTGTPQRQIFVMNADGSDQHQVGTLTGAMPTWSPDGKSIAYFANGNLFRASADGSGAMVVLPGSTKWRNGDMSPVDWRVR
jgi:TolB protein